MTQGTSATTYSPVQLVTGEQMALFLTRLAGLAGLLFGGEVPPESWRFDGDPVSWSQLTRISGVLVDAPI